MTNGELQDWLQEFGRHLPVIVELANGDGTGDLVVDDVDSTDLDGELVLCITIAKELL